MASFKFNNVFIKDQFSVAGPLERNGQIKRFDITLDDYYYKEKTLEQAEIKMQKVAIENILSKNKLMPGEIDLMIGGDLSNQISVSSYATKDYNIPFLGIYSACASFCESLILAATYVEKTSIKKALTITSSHNLNAEKQFRFPVEYGAPKPKRSTFTSTGSVSTIISHDKTNIRIESATIGRPVDMGMTDAFHMGAVMAPAAAQVITNHLLELKRDMNYYDLILTGDLGEIGSNILKEFLKRSNNLKMKKHLDAGCELYTEVQSTYAGGSGPVALPLVLFNKIIPSKKYHKILIVATGSLHSPVMVNQKMSIPSIAHAVSLEVL